LMPDLRDASEVLGLLRSSSGTRKKDGSIRCKMPGTSTLRRQSIMPERE
jgi:hypothetical protein